MSSFNPVEYEKDILQFWKDKRIHLKANERNVGNKTFYFCDGPPYTSGKVHIGTAWNKALKDSIIRYKRMRGFHVHDRAGYDMHGLPTENATEKKLGIFGKDQIEEYGVGKFILACKELSQENLRIMNDDFRRLGVWMDFDNAYQSVLPEYIDGEWWLVKKAYEEGRLYEGLRSMAWDWADQSAVAKHETVYKTITDESIYVKMPIKGKENEFLVIWTTTPWTIPFNLGIMVHPDLDYVRCKAGEETWVIAKDLVDAVTEVASATLEITETFKGKELEGTEYEHPFKEELGSHYDKIKAEQQKAHTVVLSPDYVDTSAGTGLVHMAPGCGPEDYEVGHRNGIRPWNLVGENGTFSGEMDKFSGRHAIRDNTTFIDDLEQKGFLVARQKVTHEYPHGDRSKKPVIFRTTKQWFFKVEDLKDKLVAENDQVSWVPKAGYNAFNGWLENLRDNSISKQRYWGTPVPIWKNTEDPDDIIVVGSIKELEELSGRKIEEPHKPWVDDITIERDGKTYKRIPDVLDVWVDAGTASWNSLGFPRDKETFEKFFPMDFILEGKDQVRGWFNLLHIASVIAHGKACFKAAYMHGFVQDAEGRKMSKSLGNSIYPEEVIEKYGADTLRYYMIGGTDAGVDINYNFDDMKVKHKNLMVLWNTGRYIKDLAKQAGMTPADIDLEKYTLGLEERYILSKLHSTIQKATKLYDKYHLDEPPAVIEELFLELSRTYLQLTRDKVSTGSEDDKRVVFATAYTVFMDALRLLSPITPFITEKLYLDLKEEFDLEAESVHLTGWPEADEKLIDKELEKQMTITESVVQAVLYAREKMHRGVRWPIKELVVTTKDKDTVQAIEVMRDLIKTQTNVKDITIQEDMPGVKETVKPDYSQLNPDFKEAAPSIIAHLATESPQTILGHIRKDGKYELKVDGKTHTIVSEHLIVTREVPEQFEEGEFRSGLLYLDKEMTDELEAEGYAREVMRRIQAARKKAGLSREDRVTLFVKTDEDLKEMLSEWHGSIAEKCGADVLKIDATEPGRKHAHHTDEKVKGRGFSLHFDKVE